MSLHVARGECVCLLGRNGVGKTTTMRSIMGLTAAAPGPRRVEGPGHRRLGALRTSRRPASASCRRTGGSSRSSRSGRTSTWRAGGGRDGGFTVERVFDLFPKLRELAGRQGGFLSGGEQQMLTIARTLMGNPDLLLLDEPSEGLAPLVVEHLKEQIARLKSEGLTILLAEQNVDFCLALADRVYVLEKGHIRYEGTADDFRADESIRHQYLAL